MTSIARCSDRRRGVVDVEIPSGPLTLRGSLALAPVLALTGSKDIQVDPADVERMGRVVPTPFTVHVIDDVTHLLRTEPGPPTLRTYRTQAQRPLDPGVVQRLTDWVSETLR
ncbi:MAG: hypothetical protein AAFP84_00940 [Actinomycetota bacterium]